MGCETCRGWKGKCCLESAPCSCSCHFSCQCFFCDTVRLISRNPYAIHPDIPFAHSPPKKSLYILSTKLPNLSLKLNTKTNPQNPQPNKKYPTQRSLSGTQIPPSKDNLKISPKIRKFSENSYPTKDFQRDLLTPNTHHSNSFTNNPNLQPPNITENNSKSPPKTTLKKSLLSTTDKTSFESSKTKNPSPNIPCNNNSKMNYTVLSLNSSNTKPLKTKYPLSYKPQKQFSQSNMTSFLRQENHTESIQKHHKHPATTRNLTDLHPSNKIQFRSKFHPIHHKNSFTVSQENIPPAKKTTQKSTRFLFDKNKNVSCLELQSKPSSTDNPKFPINTTKKAASTGSIPKKPQSKLAQFCGSIGISVGKKNYALESPHENKVSHTSTKLQQRENINYYSLNPPRNNFLSHTISTSPCIEPNSNIESFTKTRKYNHISEIFSNV
ncbi:hypothetical protein BB558_005703 [Smittium angustum]|uniref:Uncharacterized protein n=1 Tax=Smittium angustum TaxID=133377 RepID=A0A2U1IZT6_SMIAN|nr:hypothetical protein BB558_005703 [Smittium angustum]